MHIDPGVLALTIPYAKALTVGLLPLLLYFAVRRCLQAMDMVQPVAFALVTANFVNIAGNYALVYGHFGFSAMGTVGSGWSTAFSRLYMAGVLVGYCSGTTAGTAPHFSRPPSTSIFRVSSA